jgi:sulfotransferase family protein
MSRPRPNLFLIGAMKSGTTSLHAYLGSHPQIFMCPQKEPEFFAKEEIWSLGEEWYVKLFAAVGSELVIGESSTVYSRIPHFPGVAERIANFNSEARFIYIMRDPVERTISQYWYHVRFCGERRGMLTAIREDPHFTDASNYAMQLAPYFERFGSDRIATLTFEELSRNPLNVSRELFAWLGVDASFVPSNLDQRENVTPQVIVLPKTGLLNHVGRALKPLIPSRMFSMAKRRLQAYESIDRSSSSVHEVIEFLKSIQKEQVARLEEMLGRSFPEWTTLYGNLRPAGPTNTA